MMHKISLAWALLAIGSQGVRMQSELFGEGKQSELVGKEIAEKARPWPKGMRWQALMALLAAFKPSEAFSFGPGLTPFHSGFNHTQGIDKGGGSGTGTVGSRHVFPRAPSPDMIDRGSKVRVLGTARYSDTLHQVGTVVMSPDNVDDPFPVVVRFDSGNNAAVAGKERKFARDELVEVEVPSAASAARAGPDPTMMMPADDDPWVPVGTGVDLNTMVDTLSAASLMTPTGDQPAKQLPDGIVGTSSMLASLDAWFKDNPDGVVALPLGPDGFVGEQGRNTMFPRGMPSSPSASLASQVTPRSGGVVMSAVKDGDSQFVPDMQRRSIMNLILLGGAAVPVGWMGGGFVYFFVPPGGSSAGSGLVAKDALGDDVLFDKWLSTHQEGDRNLVQGLKGDAHYLIVTADRKIEDYALNAVCTHLGCVVPWNRAAGKFICPCHGSQYDNTGKVVRGPAPLSLALAHVDNVDNKVTLTPWTETDFRTNTAPWWK